ncbi:MAG: S-layer protein [Candidatus Aenigmarchaeota archaeon]|nr:S-layer protein [Candidatus Aenigmarchaeota archaeon]
MLVVNRKGGKMEALETDEVESLPHSKLASRIMRHLAKRPSYAKEIARALGEEEQKIYYHVRGLEKLKLIKKQRERIMGGAVARYYALSSPSFFVRFGEFSPASVIPQESAFLYPLIEHGRLNACIVLGSPDPHGPEGARARDAYYAVDLALFLGSHLMESAPSVVLDTDIDREGMKGNLIIVGGPVTNRVAKIMNDSLPVRFAGKDVYSSATKKMYKSENTGIIVKTKNPLNKESTVLLLAGKRHAGTKAAILALYRSFAKNYAVVEGIDSDGDGIVDDVKILE